VVTVKASQKIFTDNEVANLTGICVDHLCTNFAKSRHLGFIARAAEQPEFRRISGFHLVGLDGAGDTVSALHALRRASPLGRPAKLGCCIYHI